jgi:hypothetical protein
MTRKIVSGCPKKISLRRGGQIILDYLLTSMLSNINMAKVLIKTDVYLTLMVLDSNGDYQPTKPAIYQYFLVAEEDDFKLDMTKKTTSVMTAIYNGHYQNLRQREPNDLNYIAVVGVNPETAPINNPKEKPWLNGKCPIWEWSNLIEVTGDAYRKLDAKEFETILNGGSKE